MLCNGVWLMLGLVLDVFKKLEIQVLKCDQDSKLSIFNF